MARDDVRLIVQDEPRLLGGIDAAASQTTVSRRKRRMPARRAAAQWTPAVGR